MNENTINERNKSDIGTGVQMSKHLHHNSPASRGNEMNYITEHQIWHEIVTYGLRDIYA